MNPVVIAALVAQSLIARVSRVAGAIVGFLITTGILLWGLSLYGDGEQIALFGVPLSQSFFLGVCLIWYGFDVKAFIGAKNSEGQVSRNSENNPSTTEETRSNTQPT